MLTVLLALMPMWACVGARDTHKPITVDELIESAASLEGQEVAVSGYLRFGTDSHNLWSSREALAAVSADYVPTDDPAWDHCVSLFDFAGLRSHLLANDNRMVTLIGTIERIKLEPGDLLMSSCSELGIAVQSVRR
jgi:hypothetical protein